MSGPVQQSTENSVVAEETGAGEQHVEFKLTKPGHVAYA